MCSNVNNLKALKPIVTEHEWITEHKLSNTAETKWNNANILLVQ